MTEAEWLSCANPEVMRAYLTGQSLLRGHKRECWLAAKGDLSPEQRACAIRDIFGNPFRPIRLPRNRAINLGKVEMVVGGHRGKYPATRLECSWLTWNDGIVVQLAQAAYDERAGRVCEKCEGKGWLLNAGKPHPMIPSPSQVMHIIDVPDEFPCEHCHGTGTISDGTLDAGRLAVLTDALEEAGCGDEAILRHLRGWERCPENYGHGHHSSVGHLSQGPHWSCEKCNGTEWVKSDSPHVRGCWAINLILGKE